MNVATLTQATEDLTQPGGKYEGGGCLGINANNVVDFATTKRLRETLLAARTEKTRVNIGTSRSCRCGLHALGTHAAIGYNREYGSAKVKSVETCGSVWMCPVCRYKIMSSRAEELAYIARKWQKYGYVQQLITLTVPHYAHQPLETILGDYEEGIGISGALKKFRQDMNWRKVKEQCGYVADCRALETTYGFNGWHVHVHLAVFSADEFNKESERLIKELWAKVVSKVGLGQVNSHGVEISQGQCEYLAKWGAPNELMSEVHKEHSNGNISVMQMEQDPQRYRQQLEEYYSEFHGKKLLTWGGQKGFKKQFVREKEDAEVIQEFDEIDEVVGTVPVQVWFKIYWRGQINELLEAVEADPRSGMINFMQYYGYSGYSTDRHTTYARPYGYAETHSVLSTSKIRLKADRKLVIPI